MVYLRWRILLMRCIYLPTIKKETGQSAKEYIQNKVIETAKDKIFEHKTVNEVAYELGFKYPQHFTRLFKQQVGVSPNEYRSLN